MVRVALVGFFAFLVAAVSSGASAQSPVCTDLQRQYIAAGGGARGGGNAGVLARQVAEYQAAARAHSCTGRLFFGPRPSPHCPQIMGTLSRLQQQLAAARPSARNGANIGQIRAWMTQYGCSVPQTGGARTQWAAGARTLCVRLCDGYYFPISTGGTRRDRVKVEAEACQSMFAQPDQAALFLQRAQDDVATAVSVDGKLRYGEQPFAFQYREKFDSACHAQLQSGISALQARYMDALGELPQRPARSARVQSAVVAFPIPNLAPRARGEDPETIAMRAGGFSFAPKDVEVAAAPRMRMVGDDFYRDLYDPDLPPVEVSEHRAPLGFDLISNARAAHEAETATQ